jgi:hypothetical protein
MVIRESESEIEQSWEPAHGADVLTFDNKRLGTVKAIGEGRFQVGGRWGRRGFWLDSMLIRRCEPDRVTLHISYGAVGRYKING